MRNYLFIYNRKLLKLNETLSANHLSKIFAERKTELDLLKNVHKKRINIFAEVPQLSEKQDTVTQFYSERKKLTET